MSRRGIDVLLLTSLHSMYYLFGYERIASAGSLQVILLPASAEPVVVMRGLNYVLARQSPFLENIHSYADGVAGGIEVVIQRLADIRELATARVGLELDHSALSPRSAQLLSGRLAAEGVDIVDASSLVTALRVHKSPAEIVKMKRAGQLLDIVYSAAFEAMKPGARECEITGLALEASYAAGADYCIYPPLLSSGINTLICTHLPATRRELQVGDPVLMECGAAYQRYHVVGSHTVICGADPKAEMAEHYLRARRVVDAGRDVIGPGVPIAEVAKAMLRERKDEAQQYRAGNQLGYSTGVGFQDVWYDYMGIHPDDPLILQEGMVFSLFGSYLHSDRYVMHSVDPVVITVGGFGDLCQLPRDELRVVGR
jgi:Xaa-Pro dipeptidase